MNFLIAEVIKFVSGTMITFSQRGAVKMECKQFSVFGSRTDIRETKAKNRKRNRTM